MHRSSFQAWPMQDNHAATLPGPWQAHALRTRQSGYLSWCICPGRIFLCPTTSTRSDCSAALVIGAVPIKPGVPFILLHRIDISGCNTPTTTRTHSVKRSPVVTTQIPVVRADMNPSVIGGSCNRERATRIRAGSTGVRGAYRIRPITDLIGREADLILRAVIKPVDLPRFARRRSERRGQIDLGRIVGLVYVPPRATVSSNFSYFPTGSGLLVTVVMVAAQSAIAKKDISIPE